MSTERPPADIEKPTREHPTAVRPWIDGKAVTARTLVPHGSVVLRRGEAPLQPRVSAHVTYDDYSTVTVSTETDTDSEECWEASGSITLSPTAARELAAQLLDSAAAADDATTGPPGYLVE